MTRPAGGARPRAAPPETQAQKCLPRSRLMAAPPETQCFCALVPRVR